MVSQYLATKTDDEFYNGKYIRILKSLPRMRYRYYKVQKVEVKKVLCRYDI